MGTIEEHISDVHKDILINGYGGCNENGSYRDCTSISENVLTVLSENGFPSFELYFAFMEGHRINGLLIPRSGWGWHRVACSQGNVYDPLFGEPLTFSNYFTKTFNLPFDGLFIRKLSECQMLTVRVSEFEKLDIENWTYSGREPIPTIPI